MDMYIAIRMGHQRDAVVLISSLPYIVMADTGMAYIVYDRSYGLALHGVACEHGAYACVSVCLLACSTMK